MPEFVSTVHATNGSEKKNVEKADNGSTIEYLFVILLVYEKKKKERCSAFNLQLLIGSFLKLFVFIRPTAARSSSLLVIVHHLLSSLGISQTGHQ